MYLYEEPHEGRWHSTSKHWQKPVRRGNPSQTQYDALRIWRPHAMEPGVITAMRFAVMKSLSDPSTSLRIRDEQRIGTTLLSKTSYEHVASRSHFLPLTPVEYIKDELETRLPSTCRKPLARIAVRAVGFIGSPHEPHLALMLDAPILDTERFEIANTLSALSERPVHNSPVSHISIAQFPNTDVSTLPVEHLIEAVETVAPPSVSLEPALIKMV